MLQVVQGPLYSDLENIYEACKGLGTNEVGYSLFIHWKLDRERPWLTLITIRTYLVLFPWVFSIFFTQTLLTEILIGRPPLAYDLLRAAFQARYSKALDKTVLDELSFKTKGAMQVALLGDWKDQPMGGRTGDMESGLGGVGGFGGGGMSGGHAQVNQQMVQQDLQVSFDRLRSLQPPLTPSLPYSHSPSASAWTLTNRSCLSWCFLRFLPLLTLLQFQQIFHHLRSFPSAPQRPSGRLPSIKEAPSHSQDQAVHRWPPEGDVPSCSRRWKEGYQRSLYVLLDDDVDDRVSTPLNRTETEPNRARRQAHPQVDGGNGYQGSAAHHAVGFCYSISPHSSAD